MSAFYDQASLVVVPSGYKSGKIYAQKPLTTDGQLTFTRASTATRVNASGLIETVASGVPRLDYLGSTCPKLLLEPQRTNLFKYSEQFDESFWTKSGTTLTPNTTISPDGTQNADTMTTTASTSRLIDTSVYGAGTYTGSLYVKRLTGNDNFQFRFVVDGSNQIQNFDVTSEWQRFTLTVTAASELRDLQFRSSAAGTGTFAIWGAQLEAGAYPTSYVKTEAAAVTRLADSAILNDSAALPTAYPFTMYVESEYIGGNRTPLSFLDASRLDRYFNIIILSNVVQSEARANGPVESISSGITLTNGQRFKAAFTMESATSGKLAVNGTVVSKTDFTSQSYNVNINDLLVGQLRTATDNGERLPVNSAIVFKTALTTAQLAELTTL
jgi:hypothetical protein